MSRLRITIDSTLSEIFMVSMVLHGVCSYLGMDEAEASSVDLCAVEAVTNTIKHAYLGDAGHEISIDISFTRERLDLDVRDQGVTMPRQHQAKLRNGSGVLEFDTANLEGVPEGGMGLQIIHEVMDVAIYFTKDGTNCLRMTKLLTPNQPVESIA